MMTAVERALDGGAGGEEAAHAGAAAFEQGEQVGDGAAFQIEVEGEVAGLAAHGELVAAAAAGVLVDALGGAIGTGGLDAELDVDAVLASR